MGIINEILNNITKSGSGGAADPFCGLKPGLNCMRKLPKAGARGGGPKIQKLKNI
jgi:hypothetical protein